MRRDGAGRFLPRVFSIGDPRWLDLPREPRALLPLDDAGRLWTLLDAADAILFGALRWHAMTDRRGRQYARRMWHTYLHREILRALGPAPDEDRCLVDHINGDGLDNRRDNLRWASYSENAKNTSGLSYRKPRVGV